MTTKHSPLRLLKAQADKIASVLKAAERGDKIDGRIAEARLRETFKTGLVMDDKVITIEMPWTMIRDSDEKALSAYIVGLMQEARAH